MKNLNSEVALEKKIRSKDITLKWKDIRSVNMNKF